MDINGNGFIEAIKPWSFSELNTNLNTGKTGAGGDGTKLFRDVFQSAVDNVRASQLDVENKQYLLATGQLEDAHSLPIAEAKAQVSLDLLISLRNKAMEGYNELLKMNI